MSEKCYICSYEMKKEKASIDSGWFGPSCIVSANTDIGEERRIIAAIIRTIILFITSPSIQ